MKITNDLKIRLMIIIVLIIIVLALGSILFMSASAETKQTPTTEGLDGAFSSELNIITPVNETLLDIVDDFKALHPIVEITETDDYVYTTDYVHYRTGPDITYDILGTMPRGKEIYRIGICDNGWSKVFIDNLECYMSSDYLSTEKPVIQVTQTTTTSSKYSPDYLRNMGVVYDGGWRYTWYSEKVLPGGGLNIPGRWSDGNFVRDGNGYICVASSDLAKGTVIETPWGTAKVYDCGCASGTIDVYTSWG